jgi:DNA-binding transcriptional LysR family regulator
MSRRSRVPTSQISEHFRSAHWAGGRGSRVPALAASEEHSVEVLFQDPLVVVTGPNNPLIRRRKVAFAELLEEPWTLQPRENSFGAFAMDAFLAAGYAPPPITIATTSSTLRGEMLATGRFLSMVPRYWVLLPRRNPSLRVLPVEFPHTRLDVGIITMKNRSLSRATELFVENIRALAKPLAKEK